MRVKDYSFVQSVYTKCCFLMFVEFSFIFLDFIIYRIRKLLKTHMRITLIENVVIKKLFRITFEGSNVSLIFFQSSSFRIKNFLLLISRFLINTRSRPFRANRPRFLHFPPRSGGREVRGNKEASSQQRKVNGVTCYLPPCRNLTSPTLQPSPPDAYSSDFFSPAPFSPFIHFRSSRRWRVKSRLLVTSREVVVRIVSPRRSCLPFHHHPFPLPPTPACFRASYFRFSYSPLSQLPR